jgi:hypothetical protein
MADESIAFYRDAEEKSVAVAVSEGLDHTKTIAAGSALLPQFGSGAAPEGDIAGAARECEAFGIEKTEHQDPATDGILNDAREQAASFGKVELGTTIRHDEFPLIGILWGVKQKTRRVGGLWRKLMAS